MKNPLNKRIYRQIKSNPFKFFSIFLTLTVLIIFSSSFFTAQQSIKHLYYKQIDDGKVEDGEFVCIDKLSNKTIKALEDLSLNVYENFYFDENYHDDRTLRIFKNRNYINISQIFDGRLANNDNEIAISANYARANKINIGDFLKIKNKKYLVTGLVSLPDYSTLLKNREDIVMDTGYFGVCLLSSKTFDKIKDKKIVYNYSYHDKFSKNSKVANKRLKNFGKIINKNNLMIDGVTRYDNKCITYIMDDMDGDVPTMISASILLFISLAFISAVQIKNLIENESPIIGCLLASGYKKKELLKNYMAMPLFLAILASICGNFIAFTYFYKKYADVYYLSFELPKFELNTNHLTFAFTTILPIFIYLVINFFVVYFSLNHNPIDFLRKNLYKKNKISKLKLKNFSFMQKAKLRLILDNKLNFLALLFGIFLANLLLVFSLCLEPSFENYAKKMKDEMKYDHIYFVKTKDENIKSDMASIVNVNLVNFDDKKIQIYGVDKNSKYDNKNLNELKKDEVVISYGLAQRFNLGKKDTIKVLNSYNNKTNTLKIKKIDDKIKTLQILTNRQNLNKLIGKDSSYFNSYLSDKKLDISKENLITEINKKDMTKFMDHFFDHFKFVFKIVLIVSLAFYFIITSVISTTIIDKSKENISYLKIFGFKDREVVKIYINTILFLLVIFEIILMPLLNIILKFLIKISMQKLDIFVDISIPNKIFAFAFFLSLLTFIITQIIESYKISKLDMVKELKNING